MDRSVVTYCRGRSCVYTDDDVRAPPAGDSCGTAGAPLPRVGCHRHTDRHCDDRMTSPTAIDAFTCEAFGGPVRAVISANMPGRARLMDTPARFGDTVGAAGGTLEHHRL